VDDASSLPDVTASCGGFYQWICGALGVRAGSVVDCGFYCDYLVDGVGSGLDALCQSDAQCVTSGEVSVSLLGVLGSGRLCSDAAKYALTSSCEVPTAQMPSVLSRIDDLLATGHAGCPAATDDVERAQTLRTEEGPPWLVDPACSNTDDCRIACLMSELVVERRGAAYRLSFQYSGDCDCSTAGQFVGEVFYAAGGPELRAVNVGGLRLTGRPLRAVNMLEVSFTLDGLDCLVVCPVSRGSLLGMPISNPLDYASDSGVQLQGYSSDLSLAQSDREAILRQLAASAITTAGQRRHNRESSHKRRLLQETAGSAPSLAECPADDSHCLIACLSGVLDASAFGSRLVLALEYDGGDCDCALIFPGALPDGTLALVGVLVHDSDGVRYRFEGAMRHTVGDDTASVQDLDMTLSPLTNETMRLDLGPSLCTYTATVKSGRLLGLVAPTAVSSGELAPLPEADEVELAAVLEVLNQTEGCAGRGCRFSCVFSAPIRVAGDDERILPATNVTGCSCDEVTDGGEISDRVFLAEEWEMQAHHTASVLNFSFVPAGPECSGFVSVVNGSFLGVGPRGNNTVNATRSSEPPRNNTNSTNRRAVDSFSKEDIKRAASVVSTTVATTVAAVVVSTVSATVGASVGGGSASAALSGGAGGGGAVLMVSQCGQIAIMGRVGAGSLPQSSQTLSDELSVFNLHPPREILNFRGSGSDDDSATLRRSATSARRNDAAEEEERPVITRCLPGVLDKELYATALMCAVAVAVTSLVRISLNATIKYFRVRGGSSPGEDALLFPIWEFQIVLLCFLGLSEAAADAIASSCLHYQITGAIVLLLLLLFGAFTCVLVRCALIHHIVVWKRLPVNQTWAEAKAQWTLGVRGSTGLARVRHWYAAYKIIRKRGDWEAEETEHPKIERIVGKRLSDRVECLFDSYSHRGWWYGFFLLLKAYASALVITNILSPTVNAAVVTALVATDAGVLLVFRPDADWESYLIHLYTALVNLGTLASAIAFIEGWIPEGVFSEIFFYFNMVSLLVRNDTKDAYPCLFCHHSLLLLHPIRTSCF